MRKLLVGLLAVGLVLFGAVLSLVLPGRCPVNRAAFERIKEGMTKAEVEAILSGPAGDYRTRPTQSGDFIEGWGEGMRWIAFGGGTGYTWIGNEVLIEVHFDAGGVSGVMLWTKVPNTNPVAVATWRLRRLKAHRGPR
jgi:hypothetical protein